MSPVASTACCSARTPPADSIAPNATCGSDRNSRHASSFSPGPPVDHSQLRVSTVDPAASTIETSTLTGRLSASSETGSTEPPVWANAVPLNERRDDGKVQNVRQKPTPTPTWTPTPYATPVWTPTPVPPPARTPEPQIAV